MDKRAVQRINKRWDEIQPAYGRFARDKYEQERQDSIDQTCFLSSRFCLVPEAEAIESWKGTRSQAPRGNGQALRLMHRFSFHVLATAGCLNLAAIGVFCTAGVSTGVDNARGELGSHGFVTAGLFHLATIGSLGAAGLAGRDLIGQRSCRQGCRDRDDQDAGEQQQAGS